MRIVYCLAGLAVIAVACRTGHSNATTVTPTGAATAAPAAPVPTPTFVDVIADTRRKIEAAPVLAGSSGWLIYVRGQDLFVGDLTTGSEEQLTHGSLGAGYAGEAVIDGITWLYYFSVTESGGGLPSSAAMLRRRFGGDSEEQLFTFHPSSFLTLARDIASVSPDGTRIAYVADDGLHVRTLASKDDKLLLQNMPRPADRSVAGTHYGRPVWSPAGRWLLVTREPDPPANAPNEGPLILDPSDAGSERDLPIGGDPEWSPDGQELCGNTRATVDDVALYTVASGEVRNLTSSWFANASLAHSFGLCAWSSDGKLASGYGIGAIQFEIAVLGASGTKIAIIDAGAVLPEVTQWLPDGTGVIVTTLGGASLDATSSAVMLDGSWRRLPNDPGYVVGTVPASR
jgi:WD40-like Beta Propeller Repeat